MPFFTIITINLNNKKGLERTIKSVLCQRFTDFEFIVVDGVSSDGSQEFILEHQSKITKVIIEKDNGVYDAMNKGLAHATGKYIQFLNSGDSLKDEHALESIAKQVNGEDMIYTDVELLEGDQLVAMKFPSELSWRFQMTDMICHQAHFCFLGVVSKNRKI
jgi:glycosyltransferase involved in cell wall biosynthesis